MTALDLLIDPRFLWGIIAAGPVWYMATRHRMREADLRIERATKLIERSERLSEQAARDFHTIAGAIEDLGLGSWRQRVDEKLGEIVAELEPLKGFQGWRRDVDARLSLLKAPAPSEPTEEGG